MTFQPSTERWLRNSPKAFTRHKTESFIQRAEGKTNMSPVAKVIELVGTSPTSWQDAVEVAVKEASKTIRHIHGVEVTNTTAEVDGDRVTAWRATVRIA